MKISKKTIFFTAVIAIVLFMVSIVCYNTFINAKPMITVYKAKEELSVGDTVKTSDLVEKSINVTDGSTSYLYNTALAVGKIVKQKIYKGEYINTNRLASKNDPNLFISDDSKRFSIPTSYIDDPYSLTFRAGDVVDIIYTNTSNKGNTSAVITSQVLLSKAVVVGAIDSNGALLSDSSSTLANAIIFQSTTDNILQITAGQYSGKFKFVKYPDNQ